MDAEARPSVQYLIAAIDAISTNSPLPPFELSPIALQRREERLAAQQRRASMAKRHVPNVVPAREAAVPLAANSVAARRLAAKRGGGTVGTELAGAIPHPGYSQPVSRSTAPSKSSGGTADDLLFSDASPSVGDSAAVSASLFDDFGSAPGPAPPAPATSAGDFDVFNAPASSAARAAPTAASPTNFFDAGDDFGAITPAAPSTSTKAAAADLFGGDDFFSGGAAAPPPAPASSATHTADSFDMFSSPAPAASKSAPPTDVFGSGSDLLSDMSFATAPPPSQAQKASNILNLFEQTAPAARGGGGGMSYDPFSGMGPPGGGPAGRGMGGGFHQPPQGGSYGSGGGGGYARGGPGAGPAYSTPGMFSSSKPQQEEHDPFGALGAVKKK